MGTIPDRLVAVQDGGKGDQLHWRDSQDPVGQGGGAPGQAEEEVARECSPLPPGAGTFSEGLRVCNLAGKERDQNLYRQVTEGMLI